MKYTQEDYKEISKTVEILRDRTVLLKDQLDKLPKDDTENRKKIGSDLDRTKIKLHLSTVRKIILEEKLHIQPETIVPKHK
ncbi:MAG: hypothetical protein NTW08_09100 [Gammaproteobacteria bacterium]|nr:hypothetical protein [Gammaproteobacteria bacterium]